MTPVRASRKAEEGGALVELVLVLPVLLLVFVGAIDFARVFYVSQDLNNAARAGAQYGSHTPGRTTDTAGMIAAATTATGTPGISASASRSCQCATDAGAFSPTAGGPNNCTSPQATSCPGQHLVVTVTVTTSKTFSTIMAFGLPGFMQSMDLTRSATMRAQ